MQKGFTFFQHDSPTAKLQIDEVPTTREEAGACRVSCVQNPSFTSEELRGIVDAIEEMIDRIDYKPGD